MQLNHFESSGVKKSLKLISLKEIKRNAELSFFDNGTLRITHIIELAATYNLRAIIKLETRRDNECVPFLDGKATELFDFSIHGLGAHR